MWASKTQIMFCYHCVPSLKFVVRPIVSNFILHHELTGNQEHPSFTLPSAVVCTTVKNVYLFVLSGK